MLKFQYGNNILHSYFCNFVYSGIIKGTDCGNTVKINTSQRLMYLFSIIFVFLQPLIFLYLYKIIPSINFFALFVILYVVHYLSKKSIHAIYSVMLAHAMSYDNPNNNNNYLKLRTFADYMFFKESVRTLTILQLKEFLHIIVCYKMLLFLYRTLEFIYYHTCNL
jgi:hypothetical protein